MVLRLLLHFFPFLFWAFGAIRVLLFLPHNLAQVLLLSLLEFYVHMNRALLCIRVVRFKAVISTFIIQILFPAHSNRNICVFLC